MSYQLKRSENLCCGVRRIASEQIDQALAAMDDPALDRHQVIHEVRKRCKKIRGLIRLVRPALKNTYRAENQAFRDAARPLSSLRDTRSIIASYDKLCERSAPLREDSSAATIRQTLVARLENLDADQLDERLGEFRQTLLAARSRVADWKLTKTGFEAIRGGLMKTHHRARLRLKDALKDPQTEILHQLRKRGKYHYYHVRLLGSVWPGMLTPYGEMLKSLADTLGDDHDLATLERTVGESPGEFGPQEELQVFTAAIQQQRRQLSTAGLAEAQRLFAERSAALADRFETYWQLWRQ